MKKTIHCRICKEVHKLETRNSYYCPKVFGGWVYLRKKKAPKIVGYRICFTHRLDNKWDWSCPVWFTEGIFANAMIKSPKEFDTEAEALANMQATMKLFGQEEFVGESKKIHGDYYDYSKFVYVDSHTKGIILCRKHGEFLQIPNKHLNGQGCPKCKLPKGEVIIGKWLDDNDIEYEQQKTFENCISPKTNRKLKFDFFVRSKNLLIEFDGPQHFKVGKIGNHFMSESELKIVKYRDKVKTAFALSNNIKLIRIPYTKFGAIEKILNQHLLCLK